MKNRPPGPAAGPEASLGFHLWHAALAWKAEVARALATFELTATQFFVLGAVTWLARTRAEAPRQRDVAELAALDPMTTSQVVRALERAGLLARADDPSDSRSWRLSATERGGRVMKQASARVRDLDQRFFAVAGLERDELFGALEALHSKRIVR